MDCAFVGKRYCFILCLAFVLFSAQMMSVSRTPDGLIFVSRKAGSNSQAVLCE